MIDQQAPWNDSLLSALFMDPGEDMEMPESFESAFW